MTSLFIRSTETLPKLHFGNVRIPDSQAHPQPHKESFTQEERESRQLAELKTEALGFSEIFLSKGASRSWAYTFPLDTGN